MILDKMKQSRLRKIQKKAEWMPPSAKIHYFKKLKYLYSLGIFILCADAILALILLVIVFWCPTDTSSFPWPLNSMAEDVPKIPSVESILGIIVLIALLIIIYGAVKIMVGIKRDIAQSQ